MWAGDAEQNFLYLNHIGESHMLKIYNTLSRKKEEFVPQSGRKVKMYVCGPTVYDHCHMGHARAYVSADVTRRYLEHQGYSVIFLENFTDIDDKILDQAKRVGADPDELARQMITSYFRDMDALGVKRASFYPRVSDHIAEIHDAIRELIGKGRAYVSGTDVYFRVRTDHVGQLSRQKFYALRAGARVEVEPAKENPSDFALWKGDEEWGWDSPWGRGRPGWHIECSVMSLAYLGPTLDIHAGGTDIIFPHHECEILQSEALTGRPFVRYWMHNGMLQVGKEKMAKSLKNYFTVRDALERFDPDVIRFYLTHTHYRKPIIFSTEALKDAEVALHRLKSAAARLRGVEGDRDVNVAPYEKRFHAAMEDDLNTREAITTLFHLAEDVEGAGGESRVRALALFDTAGEVLGISFSRRGEENLDKVMNILMDVRARARSANDFKTADDIRSRLKDIGIVVEDIDRRSTWYWG